MRSDWRPIETAPHEETILVWVPDQIAGGRFVKGAVIPCRVRSYSGPPTHGAPTYQDLCDVDHDGDYGDVWPAPTHWMPLPAGPVSA